VDDDVDDNSDVDSDVERLDVDSETLEKAHEELISNVVAIASCR
jgi:hypothetical protein